MSISTKLTLLILVLPIVVLLIFDLASSYFYETIIEVSSLIAAIAIILLVWERLRDSFSKKLEYVYEHNLSQLYEQFKMDIFHFGQTEVEKIKLDLKRYGRFIGISLYPRNLLNQIDGFLMSYEKFASRLRKINDIGRNNFEKGMFDEYLWYHVLGIRTLKGSYLQRHLDKPQFKLHQEKVAFVEEHPMLIEETKEYLEKIEKMKREILEKLEDFLKSNNLELPELQYDIE